MTNNDKQMLVGLVGAIILFNVLYHYWLFIMGGLAIFGAVHVIRGYNRNR